MSLKLEIEDVLQTGVSDGAVAGVTAAITDRNGLLYEGGFGERAAGSGVEMTPDTVCMIASMTKAVTGTAAMQLVERGVLNLDEPAAKWAPYLGEVQVLEGLEADEEVVDSALFLIDSESKLREATSKMMEVAKREQAADGQAMLMEEDSRDSNGRTYSTIGVGDGAAVGRTP